MNSTTTQVEVINVALEIPLGSLPSGYEATQAAAGRINLGRTHLQIQLKRSEAEMMLRIREGLIESRAVLNDGRRVMSNPDAIRWLLSKLENDSTPATSQATEQLQAELDDLRKANELLKVQTQEPPKPVETQSVISEDDQIRNYLAEHGTSVSNKKVVEALRVQGVVVQSAQVTKVRKAMPLENV